MTSSAAVRSDRAFTPIVEVIAAQSVRRTAPDLSLVGILRHFPGLAEAEAACLTGSTAAGWSNSLSDIDIYVFADHAIALPDDETSETWPWTDPSGLKWQNWMGVYGEARVDVKVWPTDALDTVLAPYRKAEVEFCAITPLLQDFVYRHYIGRPLKNEAFFHQRRQMLDRSSYRRALARFLKANAENCLMDIAGQIDAGDDMTARLSAVHAATIITDASLILAGELCRREKWLLRRLASKPECGIGVDEFRTMVLDGARPGESDGDCALRMARWTQLHMIRLEETLLTSS
jgi:hypothetical protein